MPQEYTVKRKLQEQSGSYFVILPKMWIEALGLEESTEMTVTFNGIVKIEPPHTTKKNGDANHDQTQETAQFI